MNRYRFDIAGFFSLIPAMLRKGRLTMLLHKLLLPLEETHRSFSQFRDMTVRRWEYSGQVFSLQKAVREYCGNRYCRITDGEDLEEFFVPYNGEERLANYRADVAYIAEPQAEVLYSGSRIEQSDFIVYLPAGLYGRIDENGLRAMIDGYKLAGKFYSIVYFK